MNDLLQHKLCEIVAKHKQSICQDAELCQKLLQNYSQQYPGEVFLLVSVVKEGLAAYLSTSSNNIPKETLLERLSNSLQNNFYITEISARWAIESWAIAVGILIKGEWQPTLSNHISQPKFTKLPQQKLCKIIKDYGLSVCHKHQECETLLLDNCRQNRREVAVIINALKTGVVASLITSSYSHEELIQQLQKNLCLTPETAEWALKIWVKALRIDSIYKKYNHIYRKRDSLQNKSNGLIIPSIASLFIQVPKYR